MANRVRRVATGWESEFTIAMDDSLARRAMFDLIDAFYAQRIDGGRRPPASASAPRCWPAPGKPCCMARPTWRSVSPASSAMPMRCEPHGPGGFVFLRGAPTTLARAAGAAVGGGLPPHRIVAVADTARQIEALTVGIVPGRDVLTEPSLAAKLEAIMRGLGCGRLPAAMVRRHIGPGPGDAVETDPSHCPNPCLCRLAREPADQRQGLRPGGWRS